MKDGLKMALKSPLKGERNVFVECIFLSRSILTNKIIFGGNLLRYVHNISIGVANK